MAEANPKATISTKQNINQTSAKRDVFLGICLFVGVNFMLALAESAIINFFWTKDSTFFANRSSFKGIIVIGTFSAIFLINIAILIYLIMIKRPLMGIGILAIPILMLLLVVLWFTFAIVLFLLWCVLIVLNYVFGVLGLNRY